jgi:hypothetical protein
LNVVSEDEDLADAFAYFEYKKNKFDKPENEVTLDLSILKTDEYQYFTREFG